jgi:hypothetical protein
MFKCQIFPVRTIVAVDLANGLHQFQEIDMVRTAGVQLM